MPTNKPKVTLVYSTDNTRRAIEADIDDRCVVNGGTSRSREIERILLDNLAPRNELAKTCWLHLHEDNGSVQEVISFVLDLVAVKVSRQRECAARLGRDIVELAAEQAWGLPLQQFTTGHVTAMWGEVVSRLESAAKGGSKDAEIGVAEARELCDIPEPQGDGTPFGRYGAKDYFDVVLWNWDTLGDEPCTYKALATVVYSCDGWPNDARARLRLISRLDGDES